MALPSFTTPRLDLKPRSFADIGAVAAMDADPEVMRFIGDGRVPHPVLHWARLARRFAHDFGPGMGVWTVTPAEAPDRFLGWVALHPLPGHEPEVEIGWRFQRQAWNRGYATEAARRLMRHAFETLALPRIVAVLNPGNEASRRVCEKLGMEDRGLLEAYGGPCAFYVREAPTH